MKSKKIIPFLLLGLYCFFLFACEEFVEVEVPNHLTTSSTIYENDETAKTAIAGIYNQLFQASFANGGHKSITFLAGLTADNFVAENNTLELLECLQNDISQTNSWNYDLWGSAYNIIYMTNALLEGVEQSSNLSGELKLCLEGQAKFIRGFTYWQLLNLYGSVPLILQTDYKINQLASRNEELQILQHIILDLKDAEQLLEDTYINEDRTRPNRYAAQALLARVYLYQENWSEAQRYSNQVISQASQYELLGNIDHVFLANSREAIWQISPIGWGNSFNHTREGNLFIKNSNSFVSVSLSDSFMQIWQDTVDIRRKKWVGDFVEESDTLYFPFKYKIQYDASSGSLVEYSMVMRLAEQYLIRAEARVQQGDLAGAVEDINMVRQRANLPQISSIGESVQSILDKLYIQKRKEFFAEWGHRWFDLKRTNQSLPLASKPNANWQETDFLFPIPEQERLNNPNLSQNPGY